MVTTPITLAIVFRFCCDLFDGAIISWLKFDTVANGSPWMFNPFAYQFLFVLGMLFGYLSSTEKLKIPFNYPVLFIALLILLATFIFHNVIPFLQKHFLLFTSQPLHNGLPLTGKINEEPLGIFHFMVLMYVVVFVINFIRPQRPSLVGRIKKLAQPIISCGQNSIYIFSLGILLLVATWLTSRKKGKCRQVYWVRSASSGDLKQSMQHIR